MKSREQEITPQQVDTWKMTGLRQTMHAFNNVVSGKSVAEIYDFAGGRTPDNTESPITIVTPANLNKYRQTYMKRNVDLLERAFKEDSNGVMFAYASVLDFPSNGKITVPFRHDELGSGALYRLYDDEDTPICSVQFNEVDSLSTELEVPAPYTLYDMLLSIQAAAQIVRT